MYYRGIRDGKISLWLAENSYGTAVDLGGIRNFSITTVVSTDQLKGDDRVLDRYSRLESVTVSFEQAEVNQTVLNMLMGGTLVSNATYEDVKIGEADAPYVALAGKVVASNGNELHLFVPKCRLMSNLTLQAQVDTYMIPSAEFEGVYEGTINEMFRRRKFLVTTALEIPLRTTAGIA
jgi:hypothetical protein